jgi:selenide,water dikinase
MVEFSAKVPDYMRDILFDPQTSGGLLISVAAEKAEMLLDKLKKAGISEVAIVGEIISQPAGKIIVK